MNLQRSLFKRDCLEMTAEALGWKSWYERRKKEGDAACLPVERAVDITIDYMWEKTKGKKPVERRKKWFQKEYI